MATTSLLPSLLLLPLASTKVAFPHVFPGAGTTRCESTCTPGGLGTLRTRAGLCTPELGVCAEEVQVEELASRRCAAYAKLLPFLHPEGRGKQVQNQPSKGSWLPCAVFCETVSGAWYSPRQELAPYHLSSTLPEGTLCHSEGGVNHFCQDSLCLPRDPALVTRGLLLQGRYTHTDRLILDTKGHIQGVLGAVEEGGEQEEEDGEES